MADPTEQRYDALYFKEPVLGHESYHPNSWSTGDNGVTFDIATDEVVVSVLVPWDNILFVVESQAWLGPEETIESYYFEKERLMLEKWERLYSHPDHIFLI